MRTLPTGMDEFPEIRSSPTALYVDKTKRIADLCALMLGNQPQIFLSRPRRFGKTLLVSTLEALFQGQRDWFQGTWIGRAGHWDWERHQYPVLRLDLSIQNALSREELARVLRSKIIDEAEDRGVEMNAALSADTLLSRLVKEIYRRHGHRRVAVLIDEYDTPITEVVDRPELAQDVLAMMRSFYGALKSVRKYLRCTFMTGITRLAHAGLFSGANHFDDVSLDPDFNALLGFTQRELRALPELQADIARCARNIGCSAQEMDKALRRRYNGYQFSKKRQKVYNPYSVAACLAKFRKAKGVAWRLDEMPHAWAHSGTPSALFRLWQRHLHAPKPLADTGGMGVVEFLDQARYDASSPDMTALMYQAGYLTLVPDRQVADPDGLRLGFPNQEVRRAYLARLSEWQRNEVNAWHVNESAQGLPGAAPIGRALLRGDASGLLASLDDHLQRFSYPAHAVPGEMKAEYDYETHYRKLLFSTLLAAELHVQAETPTLRGRIDLLVESADQIICLECKTNLAPEQALRQVWHKGYVDAYRRRDKSVTVFGLSFHTEARTVSAVAVHRLGRYHAAQERWDNEPFAHPDHALTKLGRMGNKARKKITESWTHADP